MAGDRNKPYYTAAQREIALSELERHGDIKAAARFAKVPVGELRRWAREAAPPAPIVITGRPLPPMELLEPLETEPLFAPAQDLLEWVRSTFLENGPLHNPDHEHLNEASIGFLWTNVPNMKGGRQIVGTAEIPTVQGSRWVKARNEYQLTGWFGHVPHFVITLDAIYCAQCSDASFCALIEHELYHCAQALNEFGEPRFDRNGFPVFRLRAHDVEEFVGVTRRYGPGASSAGVLHLVEAASQPPTIAYADIAGACGVCLRMAA